MSAPTFTSVYNQVQGLVWPDRIPRNLKALAQTWFVFCLGDLQKKIPLLRTGHKIRYRQEDTYYLGGVTILDAPREEVTRVQIRQIEPSGIITGNDVNADPISQLEMNALMNYQFNQQFGFQPFNGAIWAPLEWQVPTPANTNQVNGWGMMVPDPTMDRFKRWDVMRTAMFEGFIWVWPWINSDQEIVVSVKQEKGAWLPDDEFPDTWLGEDGQIDNMLLELMVAYMEAKRNEKQTYTLNMASAMSGVYATKVAELIIAWDRKASLDKIQRHYYPKNE